MEIFITRERANALKMFQSQIIICHNLKYFFDLFDGSKKYANIYNIKSAPRFIIRTTLIFIVIKRQKIHIILRHILYCTSIRLFKPPFPQQLIEFNLIIGQYVGMIDTRNPFSSGIVIDVSVRLIHYTYYTLLLLLLSLNIKPRTIRIGMCL